MTEISESIEFNINTRLQHFISIKKIPHIIFHGPCGSGKHTILFNFINQLYKNDKKSMSDNVMYVNCAHTKGIRFIRDELKFFAKTNIQITDNVLFKSIVLFNADKLTVDAQSALRRCIEQFSNNTRFFIIVENKDNLLKPILSRFCDIYIPYNISQIKNNALNVASNGLSNDSSNIKNNLTVNNLTMNNFNNFKGYYTLEKTDEHLNLEISRTKKLKRLITQKKHYKCLEDCYLLSCKLYNMGYSGLDIFDFIKCEDNIPKKYLFLIHFDKIKKEFRNDKNLIFIILYFIFMRKNIELENILTI